MYSKVVTRRSRALGDAGQPPAPRNVPAFGRIRCECRAELGKPPHDEAMGKAPEGVCHRGAQRTKLWVRMPPKPCLHACLQVREEEKCFESRDGQFTGHPVLCKAW